VYFGKEREREIEEGARSSKKGKGQGVLGKKPFFSPPPRSKTGEGGRGRAAAGQGRGAGGPAHGGGREMASN
jgi:hypothetical protein